VGAPVFESVLELVGGTPMLRLRREHSTRGAQIWLKCEHMNPGGSVKDRICLAMLRDAKERGVLRPGQPVVEPTSGNTGIGLAIVCSVEGHPLTLTMPASMSLERRALLEAYGAKIVFTEPEEAMDGALRVARQIASETGAFMPQQFDNPANPRVHDEETGREIIQALAGQRVRGFVSAVGTGGTISGVGRALRREWPDVHIAAVEPTESPVLAGGKPGPSKIQGIGAGFIPRNYDATIVDEIVHVSDHDAWHTKDRLAREEGILVGISAGANVWAARAVARSLDPDEHVVTILCDTGERYFSLGEYFP